MPSQHRRAGAGRARRARRSPAAARAISCGSPVRMTCGEPTGESDVERVELDVLLGDRALGRVGHRHPLAQRCSPSGCSSSTKPQSANAGHRELRDRRRRPRAGRASGRGARTPRPAAPTRRRAASSSVTSSKVTSATSPRLAERHGVGRDDDRAPARGGDPVDRHVLEALAARGAHARVLLAAQPAARRVEDAVDRGVVGVRGLLHPAAGEPVRGGVDVEDPRRARLDQQQGRGDGVEDRLELRQRADLDCPSRQSMADARPSISYSRRKPSNRRRWPSSSRRIAITMSLVTGSMSSVNSMMRL